MIGCIAKKGVCMPLVYICSPYRGDTELNASAARLYCKFAVDNNAVPIAPHLLFPQFMDDTNAQERELAMRMNMIILDRCDEVWVFGNEISEGMEQEIKQAEKLGKEIRYFGGDGGK